MSAQRRSVLVVEDDVDVRGMLLRVLGSSYDVSIADDGDVALLRFEQGERFDAVVCDVCMPRMNGPVLVEHLLRLDPDQAGRVIVLTGDADSAVSARLSSHFVVEKPFRVRELRELVARVSAAAHDGELPTLG
ncbi:MAG: hybrid sensor histidine kinase/response regulator [Myxococcales bacterium]|nr:hybrid sensor histidine kinase/response regulator [Myxococcales bacterium]